MLLEMGKELMEQKWDEAFRFQMASTNDVLIYVIKNEFDPVEIGQILETLMGLNLDEEMEIPVVVANIKGVYKFIYD